MSDSVRDAHLKVLQRAELAREALEEEAARNWLGITYRRYLYGGWTRDDGSIAPPHRKAIQFHEACKALFCPWCDQYLGQIGSDPDQTWKCSSCGQEAILPKNKAPAGDHLLSGPSFSKHFPLTLNPYFEEAMGHRIEDTVKNQQKVVTQYMLEGGDKVHCLSYEQYLKTGRDQTSPFEGPRWRTALFDEPPPKGAWTATKRGLLRAMSRNTEPPIAQPYYTIFIGGGNQSSKSFTSRSEYVSQILGYRPWDGSLCPFDGIAVFAGTPLDCPWMFHEIYQEAWNKGGSDKTIFAIEFDIKDNPSLTQKAIDRFIAGMSPAEREARQHGRFRHLTGRIFPEWDTSVHTFDSETWDPLRETDGSPSDHPVIMACDPHPSKPWMMTWSVLTPDERYFVVREWPEEDYYRGVRNAKYGFDDYAAIIAEVESTLPGGSARVTHRAMDPNMGKSPRQVGTTSTTIQEEMEARGLFFEVDGVNDKLDFGHGLIHTHLRFDETQPISETNRPRLYVERRLINVNYGFENYLWDDKKANDTESSGATKPQDKGKDCIDPIRYTLVLEVPYISWKTGLRSWENYAEQAADEIEDY